MKKLIVGVAAVLGFIGTANAQIDCRRGVDHKHPICYSGTVVNVHNGHGHGNHHWHHNRPHPVQPVIIHKDRDWVAPVVGAIVIGAAINEISRQQQQPAPAPTNQVVCSEWRETQDWNGRITRERTCRPL